MGVRTCMCVVAKHVDDAHSGAQPAHDASLLHAATTEANCTNRPGLLAAPCCWPPACINMAPCRLQGSLRTGYERAWQRHFQNVLDATEVARQALNLTDVREQVGGEG